jgi:hypothetical protein
VSVSENERKMLRPGRSTCISFSCTKYFRKLLADNFFSKLSHAKVSSPVSLTDTEKSEFCSYEVLDETADSKATVLKTLNILHKSFRLG